MQLTGYIAQVLYAASMVADVPITKREHIDGITANDVQNGVCQPLTLIFARGSTEEGNMGARVGTALAKDLMSMTGGKVAVQGVTYNATFESNLDLGVPGGQVMAQLVQKAKSQCPNTKIAVGGYSQGAMVAHAACRAVGDDVSAVVLYGDPFQPLDLPNVPKDKVKKFCNPTDGVCNYDIKNIWPGHFTYAINGETQRGAEFIVQKAGSGSSASGNSS